MTSLKNILGLLTSDTFDISLYCIVDDGPNKDYFMERVRVINGGKESKMKSKTLYSRFKKTMKNVFIWGVHMFRKLGLDFMPIVHRFLSSRIDTSGYDYVIAFQEGQATRFVNNLNAKKKIAWVRSDYSSMMRIDGLKEPELELYRGYDKIICVSEYTRGIFVDLMPELAGKTLSIHNFIPSERIIELSKKQLEMAVGNDSSFIMVSIGRLDPVKRFEYIPSISRLLVEKGCVFKWLIIGGGPDVNREQITEEIHKNKVEEFVYLLGNVNNPYPIIAHSDLLVCTSLSEACPNVINEALILGCPVVSCDFGSAKEFVDDNSTGRVVPIDQIGDTIIDIIKNEREYQKLKKNALEFEYSIDSIKNQILTEVFS